MLKLKKLKKLKFFFKINNILEKLKKIKIKIKS